MQTLTTPARISPAHDVWHQLAHPLDAMLSPRSIALIGATEAEHSVGRTVLENLQAGGFKGALYPINPKRENGLGIRAFPTIAAVPGKIDLAVIVTPAGAVPGLVRACGQAGIPSAVIISAG